MSDNGAALVRNVDGLDPVVVEEIDARLRSIADGGVAVPWAVESGSRAWGFPSPDSDYDCRFFYVRRARDYLSPWRPRDVIETPLDKVLDVNGWDLVKAVDLAVRGNATVGEWLRSPLVYAGHPAFAADLTELVAAVANPDATRRHYLHVARTQWGAAPIAAGTVVRLKRLLYAVRPALALAWLEERDGVPPMQLQALIDEVGPPSEVRAEISALVAAKAETREAGDGPVPPAIAAYLAAVLARTPDHDVAPAPREDVRREASERFVAMVERWAPA